jgi:hypothetical protein
MTYRPLLFSAVFFLTGCLSSAGNNSNSALEERIQELEDLVTGSRLNALESEFTAQATEIASQQSTLNDIEGALSSIGGTVDALGIQAAENETTLSDMSGLISDNTSDIAGNASNIADNASNIAGNASAISGVDSTLTNLEGEVEANIPIRSRIVYSGATTLYGQNFFAEMRELGSFTKLESSTDIRLTWMSHVMQNLPGHCNFQPRVDGSVGANSYGAIINTEGIHIPVSVTQSYSSLGAGIHTLSVWVRGAGNDCTDNPGNYPREVFIEEVPAS